MLAKYIFYYEGSKHEDGETGLFIGLIVSIILTLFYIKIFDVILEFYYDKTRNKKIPIYWLTKDIGNYSFMVFSAISWITLMLSMNWPIYLSIPIVWIKKLIHKSRLSFGYDLDYHPSTSGSASYYPNRYKEERKPYIGIETSYVKDQFGNVVGKADTITYGDSIKTTEYKDNLGNVKGKSTTYKW